MNTEIETRLRDDVAVCRFATTAVHYYGSDKDQLANDIEAALDEIGRLRTQLKNTLDASDRLREAPVPSGAALIAAERKRQIEAEGWTPDHDDEHENGQLARAAACYALTPFAREYALSESCSLLGWLWPWSLEWWKPTRKDRVRELVKAGALIAAEIDRINRRGEAHHERETL